MTKRQIKNRSEHLCLGLRVLFTNMAPDNQREAVKVKIDYIKGPVWVYAIEFPKTEPVNCMEIGREIEKIFPEARVTATYVAVKQACIHFIIKWLGKREQLMVVIELN